MNAKTPITNGWWDGKAFTGETIALIVFAFGSESTKALLGAAASDGGAVIVHSRDLGTFLRSHADRIFVCHDATKWHWSLEAFFFAQHDIESLRVLWSLSEKSRLLDLQLLGQQIDSWDHKDELDSVSLHELVRRYDRKKRLPMQEELVQAAELSLSESGHVAQIDGLLDMAATVFWLSKKICERAARIHSMLDKQRLRPSLGPQPADDWVKRNEPMFNTWLDDLVAHRNQATGQTAVPAQAAHYDRQPEAPFGLLGIGIDVQASIGLNNPNRPALEVDPENIVIVRELVDRHFRDASTRLHDDRGTRKCFEWVERERGVHLVACDNGGLPVIKAQAWKTWLRQQASRLRDINNMPADVPLNEGQHTWRDPEAWGVWAECDPLLAAWRELYRAARQRRALQGTTMQPVFTVWPAIRSSELNLESLFEWNAPPLFRPRPGHIFVVGRLLDLKLRALAAVCQQNWYTPRNRLRSLVLGVADPIGAIAVAMQAQILDSPGSADKVEGGDADATDYEEQKLIEPHVNDEGNPEAPDSEETRIRNVHRAVAEKLLDVLPQGVSEPLLISLLRHRYQLANLTNVNIERFRRALPENVRTEIGEFLSEDVLGRLAAVLRVGRGIVDRQFIRENSATSADEHLRKELRHLRPGSPTSRLINDLRVQDSERFPSDEEIVETVLKHRVTTPAGRVIPPTIVSGARRQQWLLACDEALKAVVYALLREGFNPVAAQNGHFLLEVRQRQGYEETIQHIQEIANQAQRTILGKFAASCACVYIDHW